MIWRDRLPKAPLDAAGVVRQFGPLDVFEWISLFNGFQAELPEPYAVVEVLDGEGAENACEALRALKRNPKLVTAGEINMGLIRMWNVNPVLHQISEMTHPGTALDLGCGAGRDSVWLAANGWEVMAVDRLESNIETLGKLRAAYAPTDPVQWKVGNISDIPTYTHYELVLLHYCWDPNYFELAKKCVAPDGYLSILTHTAKHYECFGSLRETKTMKPSQLNVDGFDIVVKNEGWSIDRHFASVVLQRRSPNRS